MANREHQHTTPFDDHNETEHLPEELRQVARRYTALRVPQPTPEETSRLVARLQDSNGQHLSDLPARPTRRRARPLLEALAAVLMVSILIGSFLLVFSSRSHRSPAPSSTSVTSPTGSTPVGITSPLKTIHMINATTGWALTNTGVFYTTNSWHTWEDVTPHKAALVGAGYFLSDEVAWVSQASGLGLQAGQKPAVIISHTTNAGRTWQSAPLSVSVPDGVSSMSFSNDQNGWAEADLGGATGNDLEELFRTTDGGKSWTAVSRTSYGSQDNIPATFPFSGHKTGITFINASTGWATGPWLYFTHDGGASWQQQSLPTAPGQMFAPPTFFNARDGILPTDSRLFITHDSGTTWQPTSLLPALSSLATAFIDIQHGWVAASSGTDLYSTSDGGGHWVTITPRIAASVTSFAQLNFVSTEIGWALGYTNDSANTVLLKTTDGGQSWN